MSIETVYKSRIDTWLLVIVISAMAMSTIGCVVAVSVSPAAGWWIAAVTLPIGIGLPLWMFLGTSYTVTADNLLIRGGPLKWRVPIADITGITATSNQLSSPALSMDRLRIDYARGKSVMISPRDKPAFIEQVEALRRAAA